VQNNTKKPDGTRQLDPAILRQTLAGYKQVNRITTAKLRARLLALSDAEARAIFDDLCATDERFRDQDGNWEKLDQLRIEQKRSLRRAFEQLARTMGLM